MIPVSYRGTSPGVYTQTEKDDLRKRIIAAIRKDPVQGLDVEVFSNVYEDDYKFVLDIICSSEEDRFFRKLSFTPRLKQVIVTLPTPLHEALLAPMHHAMVFAIDSMHIDNQFCVDITSHVSTTVRGDDRVDIGIPDMLVQLTTQHGEAFPLWVIESSFSQTAEGAYNKLSRFTAGCSDIVGVTLFDIVEVDKYAAPADDWAVEQGLNEREVFEYEDWLRKCDNRDPSAGPIKSFCHTWVDRLVVKVCTWVRPPSGPFNLVAPDGSPNMYFSRAELFPNRDNGGLQGVQNIFQRTLERIRDRVVAAMEEARTEDESLPAESLEAVQHWIYPSSLLDWDRCKVLLMKSAMQTGYSRYCDWHHKFLKRTSAESDDSDPDFANGGSSSKRGLDQLLSAMELGNEYKTQGHRAIYGHISARIENDPDFADGQASPSVVFYAIRNILRPSFILGQIPDLLDLLAMVDTFRRYAVKVSADALTWQEYYTKEPSPNMRLLTKHELKRFEGYIAKDEEDRLFYILLIKNMCLLHVYYLITAPESNALAERLNDYFPGCFPSDVKPSRLLFHNGLSDGEKLMMEGVYQECKEWLIEVVQWEQGRQEELPPVTSTAEEVDAAFQRDFQERFPAPLLSDELVSDLEVYLNKVGGMIDELENYFPSAT